MVGGLCGLVGIDVYLLSICDLDLAINVSCLLLCSICSIYTPIECNSPKEFFGPYLLFFVFNHMIQ